MADISDRRFLLLPGEPLNFPDPLRLKGLSFFRTCKSRETKSISEIVRDTILKRWPSMSL